MACRFVVDVPRAWLCFGAVEDHSGQSCGHAMTPFPLVAIAMAMIERMVDTVNGR